MGKDNAAHPTVPG